MDRKSLILESGRNRLWILLIAIVIIILALLIGGYLIWKGKSKTAPLEKPVSETKLPRMANLPPAKKDVAPPQPTYPPDAPVLEQARKALREGIDPKEALAMAESLPDKPERADAAFLLLEYAAESGNSDAALAVGHFYDPAHEGPSGTIRKNPETAYEWYREALALGKENAKEYLARLRRWVQDQAALGSTEAKQLLDKWD